MSSQSPVVNSWEQLALFPGEVYELTLRVGICSQDDHCQLQLEWSDPHSGELIGMVSRPHVALSAACTDLDDMIYRLRLLVHDLTGPF